MMLRNLACSVLLAATALIGAPATVHAAVQASQNFDSTNDWGSLPISSYVTNFSSTSGWTLYSAAILTNNAGQGGDTNTTPSNPYVVRLSPGSNTYVTTPWLTGGVGMVYFYARTFNAIYSNSVVVETSTGDGVWTARGVTNYIPNNTWAPCTNTVLLTNSCYVRLRKIFPTSAAQASVFFDSISITYPPATIAITNLTTTPATPLENETMSVSAALSVSGTAEGLTATNYWRLTSSTNWTAIPMATNQWNVFTTVSNIPGQATFSSLEYFAEVSQTSDGIRYSLNSTTNPLTIRPRSSYTNLVVTSPVNATLTLSSNYLWQGIAYVSNATSAFRFQATSNGVSTFFGDSNQTLSNLLAYGAADINATNILLATTNTGWHVFTFNEADATYAVRACTAVNFDSWPNQAFGNTTNNQWALSGGAITNDAGGTFSGSYAILNGQQGLATNTTLVSPLLSNGIGNISFWYRKWGSSPALPGTLSVQIADTPSSTNWVTVATLSNILSASYVFANVGWSDLNNKAVRLLNNADGNSSQVAVDAVVVAAAGASALAANLTNSPAAPGSLDTVAIAIDLTTNNWATLTNVTLWYRAATNLLYESQPMVASGANHFVSSNGLAGLLGTVQYAVQYSCAGVLGGPPLFYPPGGTNQPYSYISTNTVQDYRRETFDAAAEWGSFPLPPSGYTNFAVGAKGWSISNAAIIVDATAPSLSNACRLSGTQVAYVASTWMTNGFGSVLFSAKLAASAAQNQMVVETSSGDGTWTTVGPTNSLTSTAWSSFTNFVLYPTGTYVRLRKLNNSGATYSVILDSIYCTPYPSDIAITNFSFNPGYPSVGQTVTAACDIISLNAAYPAVNITPVFYWGTNGVATNPIAMTRTAGNTFTATSAFNLAGVTRDVPITYRAVATFAGYHAVPADDLSPRMSTTNTLVVRAFPSQYGSVGGAVNGDTNVVSLPRLITNGLWQSIIDAGSSASNFALVGLGYSTGTGYGTNMVILGKSNNWQTTPPFADTATTGQPPVTIALTNGQYVVRFDESTGQYLIQRCAWQDFDNGEGDGITYRQTFAGKSTSAQLDFDTWPLNTTRTRTEGFDGSPWTDYQASPVFTNGIGGGLAWYIYNSRALALSNSVIQTFTNIPNDTYSFIAQGSHFGLEPLRGIGQVAFSYAVSSSTNIPVNLGVFLGPTNVYSPPGVGDSTYMGFMDDLTWSIKSNIMPIVGATNRNFVTNSVILATNVTFDIVFSHMTGTQGVYIGHASVSEWYSESQTTDLSGWVATGYYVESNAMGNGNCLKLDVTRTSTPTNQYVRSPLLPSGIKYIEFPYTGTRFDGATNASVSFTVELSTNTPNNWAPLDTISTNFNNNRGTNYYTYRRTLNSSAANLYVRIRNTSTRPNALLLETISIPGYASTNDWMLNNMAVKYTDQQYPPAVRQYYRGAGYINNKRTNAPPEFFASGDEYPNTNIYPMIRTPILDEGVGEISFWYRNWATSGVPVPARLVVQTAVLDDELYWTNHPPVAVVSNIVNTNDYLYYRTSIYDTTSRYVRIYNDDTYTTTVGRVCIDDILVTAPLASSLSMSNLTITPSMPLSTNTVDISVDVYHLFYNPVISGVTGYYGTANSYSGLVSAGMTPLPMVCIATNLTPDGPKYTYKTRSDSRISALPADTFVKYSTEASFSGFHSEATSPKTSQTFGPYPGWLAPLDKVHGTNQAFYVVLSCPTGSVWINEINVQDFSDFFELWPAKYVEVCGAAGINLGGWALQILGTDGTTNAMYVVTNSFSLPNTTNGFGFLLLGDANTTGRDMTLTNALPTEGGVRLVRKSGVYADAVAYGSSTNAVTMLIGKGFLYAGDDDFMSDYSLSLVGTGKVNNAFTWYAYANYSAGTMNEGETLQGLAQESPPPTNVTIVAFRLNTTSIWVECSGGTNGWGAAPWYSTNLMRTNAWALWTPFNSTLTPSNTYQLNFSRTNLTPCFFKIVVTNGL